MSDHTQLPDRAGGDDADRATLEAWLAEFYAPAYRTARLLLRDPEEAADAVQDAFLRLWRFRDSIPTGDAARAWRFRVVVNACFSRTRSEARQRRDQDRDARTDELASSAGDPAWHAEQRLEHDAVLRALNSLPETLRVPVVLAYFSGLSEREIATAIARRPGTVKSRLSAARALLRADPSLVSLVETEEAK